ncbi:S1 RNA-binding domain-containing protein [Candidatus Falkowbacteria bacterium]|nr:S1 RNA-binding domain-containing protein [Candidatus Falkowbacteria bacterium]
MDLTNLTKKPAEGSFEKLLNEGNFLTIPKVGDVVKAKVLHISKNEVNLDIPGFRTGVVRGRELCNESADYSELKPGDETEATVLEMENERGEMELSFRFAGHKKIWDKLMELQKSGEIVIATVMDANKGGLMINVNKIVGFLPVSQLAPEHYPRVPGGEKNKILEKLKTFVGLPLEVKVIDVGEVEEKLIVSEKAAWEEKQKNIISSYKVGDIISGTVSALADFGVFVKFDNLEGLVHISELAWQRIDHPEDVVKVGQEIKAEIIGVEGSKIFLSMKKLIDDPWKKIGEKYNVGQVVEGKVLKINPFGLFVELDPEIHGLAHISELSAKPIQSPNEVAKIGDTLKFKIISIEPVDHRLGLSLRGAKEKSNAVTETGKEAPAPAKEKSSETPAEKTAEETPAEAPAEKPAEEPKAEEKKE